MSGSEAHGATRVVLDSPQVSEAVGRMAESIRIANHGTQGLLLLGIPTRGVPLAHRIAAELSAGQAQRVPVGELDITMYRDDLRQNPVRAVGRTRVPPHIDDVVVVLVDDVLFSGRTVAAALEALKDLGRPRGVQLAVLVDRGLRELPIRGDHVGAQLTTSPAERVSVKLAESDGLDEVTVVA